LDEGLAQLEVVVGGVLVAELVEVIVLVDEQLVVHDRDEAVHGTELLLATVLVLQRLAVVHGSDEEFMLVVVVVVMVVLQVVTLTLVELEVDVAGVGHVEEGVFGVDLEEDVGDLGVVSRVESVSRSLSVVMRAVFVISPAESVLLDV